MSFAWPHLFWLLLAPAALLAWEILRTQRAATNSHPKILQAEASARSFRLSTLNPQLSTRTTPPRVLLALGLACSVVALTRPQWGRIDEPVFDQSREILIAVDLSRSMLATDIKPSRLERSKLLIRSLLEKLDGERIGLVVFSGTAFLQSPLSADYEILREFLPALGPDYLPEGGTNYQALIETSLAAFGSGTAADRFLIVLSDGEATDDNWKSLVSDLKKKDIRVISLGVGTETGSMIPDGAGSFVKDDRGAVVLSRLDNSTLRELAQATGGTYRDASSWLDLAEVLQSTVEAGRKGEFMEKNTVRLVERFQWALAPALLLLLLSFWREFPVRPRPRELKLSDQKPGPVPASPAVSTASKAAAIAVLALSVLAVPFSTRAATPAAPAPAEQLSPLGKIVTRLADKSDRTGRDWAELARETVTWGQKLQTSQQPVPEGPVRDALAAVDLGSALDAKTADWPKLRSELEALLQKPEQQNQDKPDQPPPQKDDQNKDQQQQDQKQQNQNSQDQKSDQQQQQNQQQSPSDQQQSDQPKSDQQKADEQKQDSAFGDMKDKQPPPPQPQPGETQKVGGTPEKKEGDPKEAADPSLVMPLQKLDQLRNQDSPAKLFRLMEGDKKPTPGKKGKDW